MKLEVGIFILAFILLLGSVSNIPSDASRNILNEADIISTNNEPRKLEVNENYISVLYGKSGFEYRNGFGNSYRNDIDFIESGDFKFNATENFTIKAGSEIKIYFSKSITSLKNFFNYQYDENVKNIELIDFSNFDLSLVTSFNRAFSGCNSLKTITFSNNISSILDLQNMFFLCSSLESIDLSNFDTSFITNLEKLFEDCYSLKIINLSNINTSSVRNMNRMFYGCSSLESIDLTNFNTFSLTSMHSMFYGCYKLKSINLSNFNTSLVTNIYHLFYQCSSLESIDISNFNTSLVKDMNFIFGGCSSLKSIDLSDFDTSSVTNMYGMFYGCSSLKSINLSNFDTSSVTNMKEMFRECRSLQLVDISNFNLKNLISCDEMFYNCKNISYIKFLDIQTSDIFLNYIHGTDGLNNIDNLTVCQTSDIITNQNSIYTCCYNSIEPYLCIDNYIAFHYNKNSTYNDGFINQYRNNISIIKHQNKYYKGNSKLNIAAGPEIELFFSATINSFEYFFASKFDKNVENIESIDFSHFDLSLVTSFHNAFSQCSSLKSIKFSNNISSILDLRSMFYQCISLETINLSNFDTSSVSDMARMFEGCSSLQIVDISNFNLKNLKSCDNMFYNCQKFKYINLLGIQTSDIFLNYIQGTNGLNNIDNLTVCQTSDIITNQNSIYSCCDDYYIEANLCLNNHIVLYYNKNSTYNDGFINEYRNNISYIKHQNKYYKGNSQLNITAGSKVEIFFSNVITSFKEFFYYGIDENVDNIESIDFSHFDLSLVTSFYQAFVYCRSLKSIKFSNNISSVLDLEEMFFLSQSLESIDLSNFDTSSVTTMFGMFDHCYSLKSINFSNFNTSSLKNIGFMFGMCTSLESIDLSNFDTSSVTNMYSMFEGCSSLKSINLSNFNTSSVKAMDFMFRDCNSLQLIDFSNINLKNLKSCSNMFYNCKNLNYVKFLDIQASDTFINYIRGKSGLNNRDNLIVCQNSDIITYQNASYSCCDYIIEVDSCYSENYIILYYNTNTIYNDGFINEYRNSISYIKHQNKLYKKNSQLNITAGSKVEILFSTNLTTFQSFFNFLFDENVVNIESIDFTNFDLSLVTSFRESFFGCVSLKSIKFSNNISSIIDLRSMFINCYSLESIDLTNFNTKKVKYMQSMFEDCRSLKSINFSNFNTSSVIDMHNMFYQCTSLESIDLPNFDTSSVTNMGRIFYGSTSLKSINLVNFNTSSVTNMARMFERCNSFQLIKIPNLDTSSVLNMNSMFGRCSLLQLVDISNFNLKNLISCDEMFYNCKNISYVNFLDIQTSTIFLKYIQDTSGLNNKDNLTVCQNSDIITNPNAIYTCSFNNIENNSSYIDNYTLYIILYYNKNSIYNDGFINEYRNNISHIKIRNNHYKGNDKLNITTGSKIEIFFSTIITSFQNFFNYLFDGNVVNIESIDFSHFDLSLVTSFNRSFNGCSSLKSIKFSNNISSILDLQYMFYQCTSLESIDLSGFHTSSVTNMEQLFRGCSSLKSINLSDFDTSLVTNMNSMFRGCNSLQILDISNFNLKNLKSCDNMFYESEKLLYIKILDILTSTIFLNYIQGVNVLNTLYTLTVCQNSDIITRQNIIYTCCEYNIETYSCNSSNFIVLSFNQNCNYSYGFLNKYRDDISFITYNNTIKSINDKLEIMANSKIEIHFTTRIQKMDNFFNQAEDNNLQYVTLIDLSNFDASLTTNMSSLFSGCRSLKSINFGNIDTSSVKDMSNMFYNCRTLELENLSNFDTSKVINMANMFNGCRSIKSLIYQILTLHLL